MLPISRTRVNILAVVPKLTQYDVKHSINVLEMRNKNMNKTKGPETFFATRELFSFPFWMRRRKR